MAKYVKKPILVDAFHWNGVVDSNKDPRWFINAIRDGVITLASADMNVKYSGPLKLVIQTSDGADDVHTGNFIIKDENGNISSCSYGEFYESYMAVAETNGF